MIYEFETFYRQTSCEAKYKNDDFLKESKISTVMMIAAADSSKKGVNAIPFIDLVKNAEKFGCLSVFVDVYGRGVSYIIWGYADWIVGSIHPQVSFDNVISGSEIYIVDYGFCDGSLDDTLSLWISCRSENILTIKRRKGFKRYGRYKLSRINRFRWHTSKVFNRFSIPKRHGFAHYEKDSIDLLVQGNLVRSILYCISKSNQFLEIDITYVPGIISSLLSVDQIYYDFSENICHAAVFLAYSSHQFWRDEGSLFSGKVKFSQFVQGPDVIVVGSFGEQGKLNSIYRLLIEQIARTENIPIIFYSNEHR